MKKFLCILCAVFVFCLPFFHTKSVVSSADIDNINATVNDYDINNYPTANYFDITAFKPFHQTNTNAITTVSNGLVNALVVSSQVNGVSQVGYTVTNVKLSQACPFIEVGETYTLTADTQSITKQFVLTDRLGLNISWHFGRSLTITAEMLDYYIIVYGFNIANGQTAGDCVISKIMVNKGTVAYPYSPYFYNIYNNGYESGQEYGYNNGYQVGVADGQSLVTNMYKGIAELYGVDNSSYSYVKIADIGSTFGTFSVQFFNFPNTVPTYDRYFIQYNFETSVNGVDLGLSDSSFYVSCSPIPVVEVNDTLYYTNPFLDFSTAGSSSYFENPISLSPYTIVDGKTNLLYLNLWYEYLFNDTRWLNWQSDYIRFFCNDYSVLKSISFGRNSSAKNSYNDGYSNGYSNGYVEGNKNANDTLYQKGYQAGLNYSQGFYGLLTAVFDVPVSAFTGLLNFDILGVNMVDFTSSMITLCIFIIILREFL